MKANTNQLTYLQSDGSYRPLYFTENQHLDFHKTRKIAAEECKDPERSTLPIIETQGGGYWHAYNFIEGCVAYDEVGKVF